MFGEAPLRLEEEGAGQDHLAVFSTGEVAALLKVPVTEVDYWVRSQLLVPSIRQGSGHGSRRLFGADDLRQAALIKRLRDSRPPWKPKQIARALASLKKVLKNPDALHTPVLIHEGGAFLILCRDKSRELVLLDGAKEDQYVLVIALETLEEETRRSLARGK